MQAPLEFDPTQATGQPIGNIPKNTPTTTSQQISEPLPPKQEAGDEEFIGLPIGELPEPEPTIELEPEPFCPVEWEEECNPDTHYYDNKYTCRCLYKAQCRMMCPEGQMLSPLELCECAPMAEIAALFPEKNSNVPQYIQEWRDKNSTEKEACPSYLKETCTDEQYLDQYACKCFYHSISRLTCGDCKPGTMLNPSKKCHCSTYDEIKALYVRDDGAMPILPCSLPKDYSSEQEKPLETTYLGGTEDKVRPGDEVFLRDEHLTERDWSNVPIYREPMPIDFPEPLDYIYIEEPRYEFENSFYDYVCDTYYQSVIKTPYYDKMWERDSYDYTIDWNEGYGIKTYGPNYADYYGNDDGYLMYDEMMTWFSADALAGVSFGLLSLTATVF